MDLFKEVKAIDADPDRRFALIDRAKAKDDTAVRLLLLHALYRKMKQRLSGPALALAFLRAEKVTRLEVSYG